MADKNKTPNIRFRMQRAPGYRQIHVNGCFGGPTPHNEIRVDLTSEYFATPTEISHSMTPDGLGPEVGRVVESGVINRESEVGLFMSITTAKSIGMWLLKTASDLEKRLDVTRSEDGE